MDLKDIKTIFENAFYGRKLDEEVEISLDGFKIVGPYSEVDPKSRTVFLMS